MTSNNPILVRFDVDTQTLLSPIDIPDTGSANEIDVDGNDIWFIADFQQPGALQHHLRAVHDVRARQFTSHPLMLSSTAQGDLWFTAPFGCDKSTGSTQ